MNNLSRISRTLLCGLVALLLFIAHFYFSWTISPLAAAAAPPSEQEVEPSGGPPERAGLPEEEMLQDVEHLISLLQSWNGEDAEILLQLRNGVNKLSERFPHIVFEGKTRVEGVEALAAAMLNLQYQSNRAQFQPEYLLYNLQQLQLALDALTHQEQPLWKQTQPAIKKGLLQLKESADVKQRIQAWEAFRYQYLLIRPSLLVDVPPPQVSQLDSLLEHLQKMALEQETKEVLWKQGVDGLTQLLEQIYWKEQATIGPAANKSLWQLSLAFFFALALCFTYTYWRRYASSL